MEREESREELESSSEDTAGLPARAPETPSETVLGPGEPVEPYATPPLAEPVEPITAPPPTTAPEPETAVAPPPPPPPIAAATSEAPRRDDESRGRQIVAVVLILAGIWLLADQFLEFDVGRLWPLILIIVGLLLIFRRQ